LVFDKNANFFAENWEKSQKIVTITSTPGHPDFATKSLPSNGKIFSTRYLNIWKKLRVFSIKRVLTKMLFLQIPTRFGPCAQTVLLSTSKLPTVKLSKLFGRAVRRGHMSFVCAVFLSTFSLSAIRMSTYICAYVQMCIHTYVHTYKCAYIHMCICTYVHTCICAYIHMCI
jgi:hypothetical protein